MPHVGFVTVVGRPNVGKSTLVNTLVGQKVGADFFPTPKAVAERMVEEAGIEPGMKVLEQVNTALRVLAHHQAVK